jgi:hypothetical protein
MSVRKIFSDFVFAALQIFKYLVLLPQRKVIKEGSKVMASKYNTRNGKRLFGKSIIEYFKY